MFCIRTREDTAVERPLNSHGRGIALIPPVLRRADTAAACSTVLIQMLMASCVKASTIMAVMMPLSVAGALLPLVYPGSGMPIDSPPPPSHPTVARPAVNWVADASHPSFSPALSLYQLYGGLGLGYSLPTSAAGFAMTMMPDSVRGTDAGAMALPIVILATVLVAAGAAAGVPCRYSAGNEAWWMHIVSSLNKSRP